MAAGTLSLPGIVEHSTGGGCPGRPSVAIVFFVAGLAELRRPPFDMPVADSEIIFGPYTEYTGLRFALFLLAEYAGIVVLCGLTTVLFLGGWKGPFADTYLGWAWTLIKVLALSFMVIWLRVAYPRLREDQLQRLAWTALVPLALAQLALTGVIKVAISLTDPVVVMCRLFGSSHMTENDTSERLQQVIGWKSNLPRRSSRLVPIGCEDRRGERGALTLRSPPKSSRLSERSSGIRALCWGR